MSSGPCVKGGSHYRGGGVGKRYYTGKKSYGFSVSIWSTTRYLCLYKKVTRAKCWPYTGVKLQTSNQTQMVSTPQCYPYSNVGVKAFYKQMLIILFNKQIMFNKQMFIKIFLNKQMFIIKLLNKQMFFNFIISPHCV